MQSAPLEKRKGCVSRDKMRRCRESENIMKTEKRGQSDDLRREYNLKQLKGGVRGKYAARYRTGTSLVLLSPDVAKYFPDEQAVNKALRRLIQAGNGPLRRSR